MKIKRLPKSILSKMTAAELHKLERLEALHQSTGEKMLEVQKNATVASRKEDDERPGKPYTAATQRKIDNGFKYMRVAFEATDKFKAYMEEMRKKY